MFFTKKTSLKKVYYTSFLLMIVIPVLLVFAAAIGVIHLMIRNAAVSNIQSAQNSILEVLHEDIRDASLQLSHFVYVNTGEFMDLAAATDTGDVAVRNQNIRLLEDAFEVALTPKQQILSMQFYMKDGRTAALKDEIALSPEEIKETSWYHQAVEKKDVVSIGAYDTGVLSVTNSKQKKHELILAAAFAPDAFADRSGKIALAVLIYRSGIGKLIDDYGQQENFGAAVLLDADGNVIYTGSGGRESGITEESLRQMEAGVHRCRVLSPESGRKTSYTFVVSELPANDWRIVNYVPSRALTGDLQKIVEIMLAVLLVLFMLYYQFSNYFLRNILTPVHNVVEGMLQVQEGNLDTHLDPEGQSEIRKMIHSFNRMVRTLKQSISEKEAAQARKHEAEIRALQSQINPHFLVNTLNSIRFMAQVSKFDGIRKMAEALIRIVSCSFRSNISFYPLAEELEVLDSYLYLMRIRYSEGFESEYEIDPEARSCMVPRLILQPIVENSIVHGFTGEEIGRLRITAKCRDGELILGVWDDGTGMTQEQIRQIEEGKVRASDDNTSIGFENVISRLKLNFGEKCSVKIISELGQYTQVWLRLPALKRRDDEKGTDC